MCVYVHVCKCECMSVSSIYMYDYYRCTGLHRTQTEADVIQQSTVHLQLYLSELLNAILQSATYCPLVLCQVFQQLYQRVQTRFSDPEYRVRSSSHDAFDISFELKWKATCSVLCLIIIRFK